MKAFLSSTYVDLKEYRNRAANTLERLGQQADRMEVFGARPQEPREACFQEIEACDLFVGLYAHRYGYIPNDSTTSITEQEFDHARNCGKALFCFLIDEKFAWPPEMIEGRVRSKLKAFKIKVSSARVRDTFTTPDDLAAKIATSVGRYLTENAKLRKSADLEENPKLREPSDCERLREFRDIFIRPAFEQPCLSEQFIDDFRKAISDTIKALNTGRWTARDNDPLGQLSRRSEYTLPAFKAAFSHIAAKLSEIQSVVTNFEISYDEANPDFRGSRNFEAMLRGFWHDPNRLGPRPDPQRSVVQEVISYIDQIDTTRNEILGELNVLLEQCGFDRVRMIERSSDVLKRKRVDGTRTFSDVIALLR